MLPWRFQRNTRPTHSKSQQTAYDRGMQAEVPPWECCSNKQSQLRGLVPGATIKETIGDGATLALKVHIGDSVLEGHP